MKAKRKKEEPATKPETKKKWREWKRMLILVLVMFAFRSAVADWNDVPTGSMKPTIMEGDRIVVNKLAYDLKVPFTTTRICTWGHPARGDVVVFYSPVDGKRFIKRVIGIPGDEISISASQLIINGMPQPLLSKDTFSDLKSRCVITQEELDGKAHSVMFFPNADSIRDLEALVVPEGYYFVMGDNRDNSFDSRYFGCIKRKSIVGRGTAIAFSLNRAFKKLD